jgi:hypothetical protein
MKLSTLRENAKRKKWIIRWRETEVYAYPNEYLSPSQPNFTSEIHICIGWDGHATVPLICWTVLQ